MGLIELINTVLLCLKKIYIVISALSQLYSLGISNHCLASSEYYMVYVSEALILPTVLLNPCPSIEGVLRPVSFMLGC